MGQVIRSLKRAAGSNALVRNAIVNTGALFEKARINSLIKGLEDENHPITDQLARGIRHFSNGDDQEARSWAEKIESHRSKLLGDAALLANGELGKPGVNDAGQTVRDAVSVSKSARAGRLLFELTRALEARAIVEMGTNVGISSAYIAAGQHAAGVSKPELITLDSSPYRQAIAQKIHADLCLSQTKFVTGDFDDTLSPALAGLETPDLVFIDGNHKFKPTLRFTEILLATASRNLVLVYDDIRWSDGMEQAWNAISENPEFSIVLDFNTMGVAIRCNGKKKRYQSPRIYTLAA